MPLQYFEPGHVIKVDEYFLYLKTAREVLKPRLKQNAEKILGPRKYIHPPGKYLAKYPMMAGLFL